MDNRLYPLRFQEVFRQYIWGGRRLETSLGKSIPVGEQIAESWEVVDHGNDQSVVIAGELSGQSLHSIVTSHSAELFGCHSPLRQFPLLFKFLDCQRTLSVQVHPNDAQAALLDPPDLGKTEAWVVLAAEPGSKIYAGLQADCIRDDLAKHLQNGSCEECLHAFEPQVGDCVFIPAGTVHALGAGLLIAEIQQASDTTYRLFDWNRLDTDGKPRQLHVEQSLEVTDYQRGPVGPQVPESTKENDGLLIENLVDCEKFVLNRWNFNQPVSCGDDHRFHLLVVTEGEVSVEGDPMDQPVTAGETILLPASCGEVPISPLGDATLLEIHLP